MSPGKSVRHLDNHSDFYSAPVRVTQRNLPRNKVFLRTSTLLQRHQQLFLGSSFSQTGTEMARSSLWSFLGSPTLSLGPANVRLRTPFILCMPCSILSTKLRANDLLAHLHIIDMCTTSLEQPSRRRVCSPFDGRAFHRFSQSPRYRRRKYDLQHLTSVHIRSPLKQQTILDSEGHRN